MSLAAISGDVRELAQKRLQDLGFKVTFSKHIEERDDFDSSSIPSRVEDLHDAFTDKNVKAILTATGGFNSNQLLKYLNYKLIKKNPKIICGYSDITALNNAIYKKTGLVTYTGPDFLDFGMVQGFEYTLDYFQKCLVNKENKDIKEDIKENKKTFEIVPSLQWSDDHWWDDQQNRKFIENKGPLIINQGTPARQGTLAHLGNLAHQRTSTEMAVEGILIGGNLSTLNLLQGTEFMPQLKKAILFIEDDEEAHKHMFNRYFQSLVQLPDFKKVRGLVIGRFQLASKMTDELLMKMIKATKELENLPVIINADFGHTTPQFTFPIGGKVRISTKEGKASMVVLEH